MHHVLAQSDSATKQCIYLFIVADCGVCSLKCPPAAGAKALGTVTGVLKVRRFLAAFSGCSAVPPKFSKDRPALEGRFRTPSFPFSGGCERGVLTEDDGVEELSRDDAKTGRTPTVSRPTLLVAVEPNWLTTPVVSLFERFVKIGIELF